MNDKDHIILSDDTESERGSVEPLPEVGHEVMTRNNNHESVRFADPHSLGLALQAFYVQTLLTDDKEVVDFF